MTIYIPVGTFKDPVTFQVLAASNSHWDGMAKSGQKVVANFAYRVYDRKTHQVVGKFPSAVQYTVADPMVDKEAAVREFFAAGKRGDWAGAASAFQDAYDACVAAHEGGMGDDEEDFDELEGA